MSQWKLCEYCGKKTNGHSGYRRHRKTHQHEPAYRLDYDLGFMQRALSDLNSILQQQAERRALVNWVKSNLHAPAEVVKVITARIAGLPIYTAEDLSIGRKTESSFRLRFWATVEWARTVDGFNADGWMEQAFLATPTAQRET